VGDGLIVADDDSGESKVRLSSLANLSLLIMGKASQADDLSSSGFELGI